MKYMALMNKVFFYPSPKVEDYKILVKYIKEGGMNVVSPPITGVFMPTSTHTDFDESHTTYCEKSNDFPELDCKSNDFFSYSYSDKS